MRDGVTATGTLIQGRDEAREGSHGTIGAANHMDEGKTDRNPGDRRNL